MGGAGDLADTESEVVSFRLCLTSRVPTPGSALVVAAELSARSGTLRKALSRCNDRQASWEARAVRLEAVTPYSFSGNHGMGTAVGGPR
jgi:hypothetical protein